MRSGDLAPFGGEGGVVEIDETYYGQKAGVKKDRGTAHKIPILSLVHRESGQSRSFVVDDAVQATILPIVFENVQRETFVMTDESRLYVRRFRNVFLGHGTVNHTSGEYGRGPVHTNTVEGYFSIFKRGMKGVYQHCSEKHLHRYVAEFDFRYCNRAGNGCNDGERNREALLGVIGKRLTYRSAHGATAS